MALDLRGERPQGLMISRISSTGTCTMLWGLLARAKRLGVVWLTRTSVHWADSSTAISRV